MYMCFSSRNGGGVEKVPRALWTEGGEVRRHNELPVALCAGNTAGDQPDGMS